MKTIEESAKEYASTRSYENEIQFILDNEAFKKGVEFAQRWIPVEEELPTKQGHYLVKVKNSFPKNCNVIVCEFYEDNRKFYCEYSDSPVYDAISWRQIELK